MRTQEAQTSTKQRQSDLDVLKLLEHTEDKSLAQEKTKKKKKKGEEKKKRENEWTQSDVPACSLRCCFIGFDKHGGYIR